MRSAFLRLLAGVLGVCSTAALASPPGLLPEILQRGELRVCIWPDYYGISYRNPKTQTLTGLDIEMAEALADDLDVRLAFVESSFAELIADLEGDRCDVAMFAVGVTDQRQELLRFTEPYLASDIYAITSKSNRRMQHWSDIDQPDSVVAVARGTLHEAVMRNRLRAATLSVLDTSHAREQDVQAGRADVFMTDYPYSRRMLATTDWARLIEPEGQYHVTPYAYALRQGDDAWHARLERFVAEIKRDGRLLEAARRHQLDAIVLIQRHDD
ncbi:ABC transporter substrate-binding protein [Stutzerimonas tarimensis]|uniref:ABC transporter substrate-binding protein n=1 Tax=Stutzerimonas tarimensis TaxID=1507735 RepID=A0ABV7TA83_9GAMM